MSDWQPVESAPKDGSVILAWIGDIPTAVYWREYDEEFLEEGGEPGYWEYAENLIADVEGIAQFQWWMPYTAPKDHGHD